MTYCLGIKVRQGLIALADTLITTGNQTTNSKKITTHKYGNNCIFLMTSGLRSIRDKAVTYFEEVLEDETFKYTKMYEAVNAFGELLRRVAAEDKQAIIESGLYFDLHTIVGGQLEGDKSHKLFLLYPQGNWVEIGEATPFTIIGNSGYGTPILKRTINYESNIKFALKTAFLSFDSTRVSANDVGYPLDIVVYNQGSFELKEVRFQYDDLKEISTQWAKTLKAGIDTIPTDWIENILDDEFEKHNEVDIIDVSHQITN